jgi:hypothetical protein
VNSEPGGRVTLRRVDASASHVEYEGELITAERGYPVRVRVDLEPGSITWVSGDEGSAPPWLSGFLRATLRAAWRSNKAGQPWPRRVNRWRSAAAQGDS